MSDDRKPIPLSKVPPHSEQLVLTLRSGVKVVGRMYSPPVLRLDEDDSEAEREEQEKSQGSVDGAKADGEANKEAMHVFNIVALHGWLDNASSLFHLAYHLTLQMPVRVFCVDLPGHGASSHRPPYPMAEFVHDLDSIIDALGWTDAPVGLLSHSMGANISYSYAGAFPERISALVALEAIGAPSRDPSDAPKILRDAVLARKKILDRKATRSAPVIESLDEAASKLAEVRGISHEAALLLARHQTRKANETGGVQFTYDIAMKELSSYRPTEEQIKAQLGSIECPVLVVVAHDGDFVKPMIPRRKDYFQRGEIQYVPGGHHVHMDEPKMIADVVAKFLAKALGKSSNL